MTLTVKTPLKEFPGIGEARGKKLAKLGLETAGDMVAYFPRGYDDRTRSVSILDGAEGENVCVTALVAETPRLSRIRRGLDITKVKVVDETAAMTVTFFNQSYVKDALRVGESYIFYGKMEGTGRARGMTNPTFEPESKRRFTGRIMPVYPLTAGISNNLLAGLSERCVGACAGQLAETLPERVRLEHGLCQSEFAYQNIHFPADWQALETAKRRLAFEEFFYLACGMALLRHRREEAVGAAFRPADLEKFWGLMPFTATAAQRRAAAEAAADMTSGRPMNRLVQGDVGSGKTAVAAACAWLACQSGYQAAMMAPTEILAEQHQRTLSALLAGAGIRVGLLTGSMRAAEKRKTYAALAAGEIDLVVGTHALLSEGVEFARLGLVITDEQHRFGVGQRSALADKAEQGHPHVLVMSATPIPRTLALIIYGDLDVSIIDELPPGRNPVQTFIVGEDKRQRMYGFVRKQVAEGRQAYIVCPAVEETEGGPDGDWDGGPALDLKAVTVYAGELKEKVFPDLRLALVHGKMKGKDKDAVMAAFAAGETDVLVSTTVIEVGVDVPNASLMIVENAERFGLSQLHQLRGRVGRGQFQSYCVLVTATRSEESRKRLRALASTNDGFQIAEEDLRLRGPGDFFGSRQHGLPQTRVADLAGDTRVLKEAQEAAQAVLAEDPELEWKEHAALLEKVKRMFRDDPDIFN